MTCNLLQITCNWNIPDTIIQIVASILGAFLGFLFAIKVSKLDNKKQNNEHLKNLYEELVDFYQDKNIENVKKNVTNVEDIKIINLPFLERTINFNLGYTILGTSTFKILKKLNSAIEQINYIFVIKNDYYYNNSLKLAVIDESKLNLDLGIKELMINDSLVDKYIGYIKAIYNKILALFEDLNKDSVLNEFKNNKKIKKII